MHNTSREASVTLSSSEARVEMGSSSWDRHDLLVGTLRQKEIRCPENNLNATEEALEFANNKRHHLLLPLP